MRKRNEYRKIEIVETDYEYSNSSKWTFNKYFQYFLMLLIILLSLVIIFLLYKIFYIFSDIKGIRVITVEKKNNSSIKYNNNGTFRSIKNNSITIINTNLTIINTNLHKIIKTERIIPLFGFNNFTEVDNPKISIINIVKEKENLKKLILSIQNQKFLDVEILIVDDNVTEIKSSLYDDIKSHDKRLKLIQYKNKVGNLQKRIDAINKSKGEYIIFIDSDEYFTSKENSFKEIYDKVVEYKIDILEFKTFHYFNIKSGIIYQPEIFDVMYFSNDNYCDIRQFHLSGKLIKKSLLIETFKNIDNYYLEKDMVFYEEGLVLLILFQKAKSFLAYYNVLRTSNFCPGNDIYFIFLNQKNKRDFLLYLKFFIQNTDNNVPEKRLVSSLFIRYIQKRNMIFEGENQLLINEIINLLLGCEKISDYDLYLIKSYQKEYCNNS